MSFKNNNQKRVKILNTKSSLVNKNDGNEIHKNESKKNEDQPKNSIISKINKNNSLQEDKMEIDDMGDNDFINFKNKLEQTINSKKALDKDIPILLKEKFNHIKKIQKKANEPNSISNKIYIDKDIKYLNIKAKELEKLQNSFNHNKISSQRNNDLSEDKIEISRKHKYMGNKERQNTGKLIGIQENSLEITGFTSKNHELLNIEIDQIDKQLTLNNQIENNNSYEDLFIRAIICTINNICLLINERAKLKYGLDLSYIDKIDEIDINNCEEYLKSTLKDIYLGKFLKINHEEKEKIKIWIFSLLYAEKKDKNAKLKLLNILFSKKIKEILLLYINDDPYIQVKSKNNPKFNLKRFNTYCDDFKNYDINKNIKIKEYIHSLLDKIPIEEDNEEI